MYFIIHILAERHDEKEKWNWVLMFRYSFRSLLWKVIICHLVSSRINWNLHPFSPSKNPQRLGERVADELRSSCSAPSSAGTSNCTLPHSPLFLPPPPPASHITYTFDHEYDCVAHKPNCVLNHIIVCWFHECVDVDQSLLEEIGSVLNVVCSILSDVSFFWKSNVNWISLEDWERFRNSGLWMKTS